MAPAFVVVGLGVDATEALILSQVVLSLALPLPMVTLLMLTGRQDVMGAYVNSRLTSGLAAVAAALILALNLLLVCQVIGIPIPLLSP
jgi:manganese transport protein